MTSIKFGSIELDAAETASQGNAVLGIRDSGKTYTATALAEQLFDAGIPFIAFDPIGVWRFLRVPGAGRGYRVVVAGGQEGDLPLAVASAPAIVEAAMREGVSLVIDLFDIGLSKSDWRRIVRDCVRLLLHKNKEYGLRHVFLEEAAEFVPQQVRDGEVYAEIEKLARMGGNSRLGYTLINQRAQEVNKAVLELCDNLFLHRQKGLRALDSLRKWLDVAGAGGGDVMRTLPTLPQGECWAWLGGSDTPIHVRVPAKNSLHPDRRVMRGDAEAEARPPVDVGSFVAALREALPVVEEQARANDPKILRAEVATLTRKLEALKSEKGGAPVDHAAIDDAYRRGKVVGYSEGVTHGAGAFAGLLDALGPLEAAIATLRGQAPNLDAHAARKSRGPRPNPAPTAPAVAPTYSGGDESLTGPKRQLLGAIAWWAAHGHEAPTKAQVAAIAGWKVTSGHLKNVAGSLRSAGLIDYPQPGRFALTLSGRDKAPAPDLALSFHDRLRGTLSGPQRLVFDLLISDRATLSREQLARACGWEPTSGHVKNVLGSLRTLEVIDYPAAGQVALQQWVLAA